MINVTLEVVRSIEYFDDRRRGTKNANGTRKEANATNKLAQRIDVIEGEGSRCGVDSSIVSRPMAGVEADKEGSEEVPEQRLR